MLSMQKKVLNLMFALAFAIASLGAAAALRAQAAQQSAFPTGYTVVDEGGVNGECAVASSSCTGM